MRDIIISVLESAGLIPTSERMELIEEAIGQSLSPKKLGEVIGCCVGKPGYSYRRVADLLLRKLEQAQQGEVK